MGSNTVASNGITIHESYTIGSSLTFETSSAVEVKARLCGAVFPSIIDTNSCMKDLTGEPVLSITTVSTSPSMDNQEYNFVDSF